jgi:hypothetical protein
VAITRSEPQWHCPIRSIGLLPKWCARSLADLVGYRRARFAQKEHLTSAYESGAVEMKPRKVNAYSGASGDEAHEPLFQFALIVENTLANLIIDHTRSGLSG